MFITKFFTSSTGKLLIITLRLLPNISRSKGNQAMKLGLLIEHDMRTVFLKNQTQNVIAKLASETRSLSKISELNLSLDQQSEILNSLILLFVKVK